MILEVRSERAKGGKAMSYAEISWVAMWEERIEVGVPDLGMLVSLLLAELKWFCHG